MFPAQLDEVMDTTKKYEQNVLAAEAYYNHRNRCNNFPAAFSKDYASMLWVL